MKERKFKVVNVILFLNLSKTAIGMCIQMCVYALNKTYGK